MGKTPKMVEWQQRNTVVTTWANWLSAGLDQHSQIADPQFVDTARVFRPDYAPRGDFSVKPTSPALGLGFKNFPMDSFGVMTAPSTSSRMPFAKGNTSAGALGLVRFAHGRLIVSLAGDYKVTVTNALGTTVAVFATRGARGTHGFDLKQVGIAKGVYTFRLQCASGAQTGRIVVQ